jgi:carboxypeptidase C (cathepsin A)
VFASEIYDQNQIATREGRAVLNLQSVLIGNGITDISTWVHVCLGLTGQPDEWYL